MIKFFVHEIFNITALCSNKSYAYVCENKNKYW